MKRGLSYLLGHPIDLVFEERIRRDFSDSLKVTDASTLLGGTFKVTEVDELHPSTTIRLLVGWNCNEMHYLYKVLQVYSKYLNDYQYTLLFTLLKDEVGDERAISFDAYCELLERLQLNFGDGPTSPKH